MRNDSGFGTYTKPVGGIPKADLEGDIRISLGKADSALQEHQSLAEYSKTSELAVVAVSGAYADLIGKSSIPAQLSQLNGDSSHRTVTDAEKARWNTAYRNGSGTWTNANKYT